MTKSRLWRLRSDFDPRAQASPSASGSTRRHRTAEEIEHALAAQTTPADVGRDLVLRRVRIRGVAAFASAARKVSSSKTTRSAPVLSSSSAFALARRSSSRAAAVEQTRSNSCIMSTWSGSRRARRPSRRAGPRAAHAIVQDLVVPTEDQPPTSRLCSERDEAVRGSIRHGRSPSPRRPSGCSVLAAHA